MEANQLKCAWRTGGRGHRLRASAGHGVGTTATPPSGVHTIIGGTGKYAGVSGEARCTVHYLKPPAEDVVMFAVPHEVVWVQP